MSDYFGAIKVDSLDEQRQIPPDSKINSKYQNIIWANLVLFKECFGMDINNQENTSSGEIRESEEQSSNEIKAPEDIEEKVQNDDEGNKGKFIEIINNKIEVLIQ